MIHLSLLPSPSVENKARIQSLLSVSYLTDQVTGYPAFDLSQLQIDGLPDLNLPDDLRLGHLIEKAVSGLLNASENFQVLEENLQLIDNKITIGELDFIIQNKSTQQITHLELAYKFYLLDPMISDLPIEQWIGPNRKDSLKEKLAKLKSRQLPLLHHELTMVALHKYEVQKINQALCFMVNLYLPYHFKGQVHPALKSGIKGYYMDFDTFLSTTSTDTQYYLPSKTEWGIDPAFNENWNTQTAVLSNIEEQLAQEQSVLCWQQFENIFQEYFITWW